MFKVFKRNITVGQSIKKVAMGLWRGIEITKKVTGSLLFLLIVFALGFALFHTDKVEVKPASTLVVNLSGNIVEEASFNEKTAIAVALSGQSPETRLRDVVRALKLAQTDKKIVGVLLELDDLGSVGLASIREIGAALDALRESGKKITAWSTSFNQKQYAIAAHASEVYVHPMGEVLLTGLSSTRLFWGEALNRLGVTVHVFKAGAYKSFPETFIRKAPSEESLKAERAWLTDAWQQLAESIQTARGLMPGSLSILINTLEEELERAGGDMSRVALNANLVDGIKTFDEVQDLLVERAGGKKGVDKLKRVHYLAYLDAHPEDVVKDKVVAAIAIEGDIREGVSDMGHVGAKTVTALIRRAAQDKNVAALLLRVDSPGGSAVASELIRHEAELFKASGKPVVVSMGDSAASGGYWLSLAADKIVADPMTITGSIGVFGLMPTFERTLDKLSLGIGGVKTEWLAGSKSLMQPMDPKFAKVLEKTVARTYKDFLALVAKARHMKVKDVEPLAQGLVYTGRQAERLKLVDALGGVKDAKAHALKLAKLPAGTPLVWFETTPDTVVSWVGKVFSKAKAMIDPVVVPDVKPIKEAAFEVKDLLELSRRSRFILAHSLIGQSED